jgi:hypothetical protein
VHAPSSVVDSFYLDALRKADVDELLAVLEWTIAEPVA